MLTYGVCHTQAQPAADKAGVVVVLWRAHARLAPLAERAGRGRARGHASGHAPSGLRQQQQPDQGASLLAPRRRGEAARDASPGPRGRAPRELPAEQRAGASGARAVHTARHMSRSIAMQPQPETMPKRRPRQTEWSTGSPQALVSCGELDWAWKPSRCPGRAGTAACAHPGDRTQAARAARHAASAARGMAAPL